MKQLMKRFGLLMLAMLPIASIAFAAKSSLSVAQISQGGASDSVLGESTGPSLH